MPLLHWLTREHSPAPGPLLCEGPAQGPAQGADLLADLAEQAGNGAAQGVAAGLAPPEQASHAPLLDWLSWGKPNGQTRAQQAARDEAASYEVLLAMRSAGRAAQASVDREQGLETEATHIDDLQRRVGEAVQGYARLPLPGGGFVPAPYQLNLPDDDYGLRRATTVPLEGVPEAHRRKMRVGKGSVEELGPALHGIAEDEGWNGLRSSADDASARYKKKLGRVLPAGADPEVVEAARVAATAQTAGLGVDCAGFVLQVLGRAGLAPQGAVDNRVNLGVRGVLEQGERFGRVPNGRKTAPSPLDAEGRLGLRPGDMMQIQNALGPEGHIAVVTQAEDLGDEIVVKYAHSTDNQSVKTGDTEIGTRVEGVREDIVAFDKQSGQWRTIRGAYGSEELNEERIRGFSRPSEAR